MGRGMGMGTGTGTSVGAKADGGEPLGFEFRLYKGPDTVGWFTGAFGGEDYTVVNVHLDVRPVRVASPLYRALPVTTAGPAPAVGGATRR